MVQWVIPFYKTTQVLPPQFFFFHKLPKISLEGSLSKQNFLSRVHLLLEPAVVASSAHLSNHLIASLPLSSLFVFPSIFVVANCSKTIPCNCWENSVWFGFPPQLFPLSTYHHFLCFLSAPVSWQCPHLCISPSDAPVFILSSVGPSVSAFTNKQRLCHLLAWSFILRVAAITGESEGNNSMCNSRFIPLYRTKQRKNVFVSVKQEREACDHTGALKHLRLAQYLSNMRDSWHIHLAWRRERQIWLHKIMRLYEQSDLDKYTPSKG